MGMKELIEIIAKALVDRPQEVVVTQVETEQLIVLELRVGAGEVGKIIGKHGRTAQAIRTILGAVNAKIGGKRAVMELLE